MTGIDLLLRLNIGYETKRRVGAHPRCLVRYGKHDRHADIAFITSLGVEEMGKIRRDDLPDDVYRRVIVAHAAQSQRVTGKT